MNTKPIRYDLIDSDTNQVVASYASIEAATKASHSAASLEVWPAYAWEG